MKHSSKQLQKGRCGDTVEGYPEPAIQQKTEGRKEGMGIRKVSNSQSDLRGHLRSLVLVPFDMLHMISY